jgi:hypothetical protein
VTTQHSLPGGGVGTTRDALPLTLGSRSVSVVHVGSYDAIVHRLTAGIRSAAVTCELRCTVATRSELAALEGFMDQLCAVLSLAAGTKVSWVSYDACDTNGELVVSVKRNSVIGRFSAASLIDVQNAAHVRGFVEQVLGVISNAQSIIEWRRAIDAKMDAQAGGYLETKALMASVVTEYLVQAFCDSRKRKAPKFWDRLTFAIGELQIPFPPDEVGKLVVTRPPEGEGQNNNRNWPCQ